MLSRPLFLSFAWRAALRGPAAIDQARRQRIASIKSRRYRTRTSHDRGKTSRNRRGQWRGWRHSGWRWLRLLVVGILSENALVGGKGLPYVASINGKSRVAQIKARVFGILQDLLEHLPQLDIVLSVREAGHEGGEGHSFSARFQLRLATNMTQSPCPATIRNAGHVTYHLRLLNLFLRFFITFVFERNANIPNEVEHDMPSYRKA